MTKRQVRVVGNVAYVPLTKGYVAVIDAADVELVKNFDWTVVDSSPKPYARRNSMAGGKNRSTLMHRAIMGAATGQNVDHIDGDGLNNRRSNLRLATDSQNMWNQGICASNKSGHKGVSWDARYGRWRAQIQAFKKKKHIGYFESLDDAVAKYAEENARLHGEFGRLK